MTNGFTLLAGWKIPHITVELLDDVVINTLHKTTVIFTFGVPGCGKSYWAKTLKVFQQLIKLLFGLNGVLKLNQTKVIQSVQFKKN